MRVFQSSSFAKTVKKLEKKQKLELDNEIRKIMQDPSIGSEKKGDLRGVFVHKFKIQTTLYLLSYRIIGEDIELIMIGPHENYYRDLKSYLKGR
ncbi:type II toxin-antitoxin system RelE/ParE family toxin [Desulfoferrobacter suflitae]|uniref:type II toxin-antitoxin system RelE/ParE family toxin n=1 Tax=Desulfoferrobacter suflitae TaxID=2865782 RepID=UPI00338EB943